MTKSVDFPIDYRPPSFGEVIGHEDAIKKLQNYITNKKFPKVIFFMGISGTGKTTLERIYGKSLLCEHVENAEPCNKCFNCKVVDGEKSTEYIHFFDGSTFGVDEADKINDIIQRPVLGHKGKKVIFIDEIQSIKSTAAQSKLYKILEKEYDNCYFIIGAMEWSNLKLATLSRTTKIYLSLSREDILKGIVNILQKEEVQDAQRLVPILTAIVDSCGGSLRQALRLLQDVLESEITDIEELKKYIARQGIYSNDTIVQIISNMLNGETKFLNIDVSSEIVEQIQYRLLSLYKKMSGCEINTWEYNQIKDIQIEECMESFKIVESNIVELFELKKFPYVDKSLLQFTLLSLAIKNKSLKLTNWSNQPKQDYAKPLIKQRTMPNG